MSSTHTELDEQLDNILTVQYNLVTTSDLKATLKRLITQTAQEAELQAQIGVLERVKQKAPLKARSTPLYGSYDSHELGLVRGNIDCWNEWVKTIDAELAHLRSQHNSTETSHE